MVDVKNDCRRVAAQENGGDGHQGLTPLAIHFRRVAAQDDDGFRSNPRCGIDPRHGMNPRRRIDTRGRIDTRYSVNLRRAVNPRDGIDTRCSVNRRLGMDRRHGMNRRRGINQQHATNQRTAITTGLVLSPKGTEVNSQGCKPLETPPTNTSSNPNGVIVASDRDQSHT